MAYADTTELARILKIGNPSDAQEAAMDRCLEAAATEIDLELDLEAGETISSLGGIALLEQVNLERAAELWKLQEVQFGVLELAGDFGATRIARDTWAKHAITLSKLKGQWGFA
jgi:hypothetical protein